MNALSASDKLFSQVEMLGFKKLDCFQEYRVAANLGVVLHAYHFQKMKNDIIYYDIWLYRILHKSGAYIFYDLLGSFRNKLGKITHLNIHKIHDNSYHKDSECNLFDSMQYFEDFYSKMECVPCVPIKLFK